jgi:ABC-type lipoprotein export system ATPase subunit
MGIKIRNLESIYNTIENSRKQYGRLRKCEFHIHTPASKDDYKLLDRFTPDQYNRLTELELLDIAVDQKLITMENKLVIEQSIEEFIGDKYRTQLQEKKYPFESFKEYLTYKLIAHKLYQENIEVAVISDHNTIQGYTKLRCAIFEYFRERKKLINNPIHLFLGVEISCSEKNHVIGIFNEHYIKEVNLYLNEILMSQAEGTHYHGYQVLSDIIQMGGIGYIAHVDNVNLNVSKAYKTKLYNCKGLKIISFSDFSKKEDFFERIKPFNANAQNTFCAITEGDSHKLEEIGQKNLWIKFNHINFQSLKKALHDYQICVYVQKPNESKTYIKGVVVVPGETGFLTSNPLRTTTILEEKDFILDFSSDLNCIIGGRGTGKSTLLNLLEVALTSQADNEDILKFISRHEQAYIVFCCEGVDYILLFAPLKETVYAENEIVLNDEFILFNNNGCITLKREWIRLYQVTSKKITLIPDLKVADILRKIYRRGYSINKLVNMINSGSISSFIRNTVLYGLNYQKPKDFVSLLKQTNEQRKAKFLRENLQELIQDYEMQKKLVDKIIGEYNSLFANQLEIVYSPKQKKASQYLSCLDIQEKVTFLNPYLTFQEQVKKDFVEHTYLTWDEVEYFINKISETMGYLNFLDCLSNKKYNQLEKHLRLFDVIDETKITPNHINLGLTDLNQNNLSSVYDTIFKRIIKDKEKLCESIKRYLDVIDDFTIRFNVNFKESVSQNKPLLKDLSELSLGQKVVAILTFVFTFGNYTNDNTPLVIDQPEDNLDSQYIYKNLIESLKKIKNNRQVIVVTHSSAIVTNADAEQVIVLESNNNKGWIIDKGYPSDERIIHHILNYLEGGVLSFKNKKDKYELFIRELEV